MISLIQKVNYSVVLDCSIIRIRSVIGSMSASIKVVSSSLISDNEAKHFMIAKLKDNT